MILWNIGTNLVIMCDVCVIFCAKYVMYIMVCDV